MRLSSLSYMGLDEAPPLMERWSNCECGRKDEREVKVQVRELLDAANRGWESARRTPPTGGASMS